MRQLAKIGRVLGVVGALAIAVAPAAAHHSTTMFDHSKTLTITGTVVELRWTNPHVSLSVNGTIKDGEAPTLWLLEMTSPGNLVRAGGWTRSVLKPGDKVQVEMSPLRDSEKKGGALKKVTVIETGQIYTANIREQEKPGLE